MKLLPFDKFTIETSLTKTQVKTELQKRIGKSKANNFDRIDQNYFFGTLTGDEFKIHPILYNKRNAWKPYLFGKVDESRTRTTVKVTMRPNSIVLFFTFIFALFGFLTTDMILKIESMNLELGLNFLSPLIAYIFCMTAFYSDTDLCKDYLIEITEGELK